MGGRAEAVPRCGSLCNLFIFIPLSVCCVTSCPYTQLVPVCSAMLLPVCLLCYFLSVPLVTSCLSTVTSCLSPWLRPVRMLCYFLSVHWVPSSPSAMLLPVCPLGDFLSVYYVTSCLSTGGLPVRLLCFFLSVHWVTSCPSAL